MTTHSPAVDDYIDGLAPTARAVITAARADIHAAVPGAGETFSYRMPTFTVDGAAFLYLGAWKQHLGVYPVPLFEGALEEEVAPYRAHQDTVRFPYRSGVPAGLVGRIAAAAAAMRVPPAG
jgi:uncharacterized protein YdhG (YjbR/CyaY superfamily)